MRAGDMDIVWEGRAELANFLRAHWSELLTAWRTKTGGDDEAGEGLLRGLLVAVTGGELPAAEHEVAKPVGFDHARAWLGLGGVIIRVAAQAGQMLSTAAVDRLCEELEGLTQASFEAAWEHSLRQQLQTEQAALLREAELRAAELKTMIDSIPDAVFSWAVDGRFRTMNRAGLDIFGVEKISDIGPNLGATLTRMNLRDPDTGQRVQRSDTPLQRALKGERSTRDLVIHHLGKGTDVILRTSAAPIMVEGRIVGGVAVSEDVTERKRSEGEREQVAIFRERVVGIVGHDLRNPLSAILTSSQLLLRRGVTLEQERIIRRMSSSALRMARMIDDLLDFTRSRLGGQIPISPRFVDLAEVVRTTLAEFELHDADRPRQLRVEGDVRGEWDPDRVTQVLSNLMTNAFKYGKPGTPVDVTLAEEPGGVRMEVHNQGPPIPSDLIPHVFDPFRRGVESGARGAAKGFGLGLYIVSEVVAAHGGRVDVRSDEEHGTRFTVHWPRRTS